ncbi:MAG: HEAT repeat domain-containing protein [Chloroflexi bacterium]|nr:HEAT repeat domain-containing protein [Chloroflexota bacterium]
MSEQPSDARYDFDSGYTSRPEPYDIDKTMEVLKNADEHAVLPAGAIYGLSDLSGEALVTFRAGWQTLATARRRQLATSLVESIETNFFLHYEAVAYVLLEDPDPEVRQKAIEMPWYVISERLFHTLMTMAQKDSSTPVRATAMSALGRFIYEGEMEEFDVALTARARQLAIAYYEDRSEDLDVRRRSLEAVSHSTMDELDAMILEAYEDDEPMMQASAVFAMGASCKPRWAEQVIRELDNPMPEIRFEAIRAAGELALADAVPKLIASAQEDGDDYELRLTAIWSLGEIGTKEATRGLQALLSQAEAAENDTLMEAIEDALETAALMSGFMLPMFEFMDDEPELSDDLMDLDDLDEDDNDPSRLN